MSDLKSKLPDFKEVTSMVCKFAKDMKNSVVDIVADYKKNHPSHDGEGKSIKKEDNKPSSEDKNN